MSRQLLELSEQMVAAAKRREPPGTLATVNDLHLLPQVLHNVAEALRIQHTKASDTEPLHPAVIETLAAIHRAQRAVVAAATDVGPAAERLHQHDIARLRSPRRGEERWDVRANQEA